jgi:hypothetical protein
MIRDRRRSAGCCARIREDCRFPKTWEISLLETDSHFVGRVGLDDEVFISKAQGLRFVGKLSMAGRVSSLVLDTKTL